MTGIRQREPAGVAQHVRMDREGHASALAKTLEQMAEALRRHRAAALGDEDVRAGLFLAL
jgi:hypothetical protein